MIPPAPTAPFSFSPSSKIYVFLYALAHFAVDAASVIVVTRNNVGLSLESTVWFILLYNTLAFATQPFIGYFLDRASSQKINLLLSFALLLTALITPLPLGVCLVVAGLANSVFHVAAGAEILGNAQNKLWSLGAFVSTGALGLAAGALSKTHPAVVVSVFVLLACLASALALLPPLVTRWASNKSAPPVPAWVIPALLFCISIRAFMGLAQSKPSTDILYAPLIITSFVFAGKLLGGFLCDRWGIRRVILFSIPLAFLLFLMGTQSFWAFGFSQFCVNLSMPITLYLIYLCIPDRPGFCFGLAASFLLPGVFVSTFIPAGRTPTILILVIFVLNLVLLYGVNRHVGKRQALMQFEQKKPDTTDDLSSQSVF